jgi:hypothetical protein
MSLAQSPAIREYQLEAGFLKPLIGIMARVARFFLVHDTKTEKMYQMNTKSTKWSPEISIKYSKWQ